MLNAIDIERPGAAAGTPLARPRIALHRPWTASMDEGWSRWTLERYGFAFSSFPPKTALPASAFGSHGEGPPPRYLWNQSRWAA